MSRLKKINVYLNRSETISLYGTTQEIDKWIKYLHFHIGLVNTLLEKKNGIEINPLDNTTFTGQ